MKILLYGLVVMIVIAACNNASQTKPSETGTTSEADPPTLIYTIINTYPHDTAFFTEGLEFHDGQLFESSGGDDSASPYPSAFGIANLKTGKVDTKMILDRSRYFGEGITFFKNKLYQLTWKRGTGLVYEMPAFKKFKDFKIPSPEGWGLTHDSTQLLMSDGSSSIYHLHPDSLRILSTITVSDNKGPLPNVNELEYVNGYIYANQWQTPYILKIDASTGKVVGKLDLSKIITEVEEKYTNDYGLNGIAYNAQNNSFFITGKKYPFIYEIRIQ